ncbi:MAG: ABC transporter permease [Lachnospiraceae bacterium]|nr:ABC transporter permease [Lachnospiraceae bacterium]
MRSLRVVMKKELDRVFKDRKLVFSLFILPAVMMVMIYGLMGMMVSNMMSDIEEHVPVIAAVNLPDDFRKLADSAEYPIDWHPAAEAETDALKEELRGGDLDLLLVFPENFSDRVANYKTGDQVPQIRTFYNPADDYSSTARDVLVEGLFPIYEQQLLSARFDDMNALTPFVVDSPESQESESSVITNEGQAQGQMLGMLFPYLVVMLLFTGPMSLGVDAIAGEKERGTLASMLITPAPRRDIVLGKLFSLEILSFLSALVYALSMIVAIPLLGGGGAGESVAVVSSLKPVGILQTFAVMLALVFLYVAIVGALSIRAKSVKEASSYISVIYIVIVIAGVMTMFSGNTEPPLWRYAVPVYGSALSLQKIITGELALPAFLLSVLSTLVFGLLLTWIITRAIDDERVVLNA